MTSSSTATVETLAAEVRVLMVGSRQVTLSVYRQLDRVPFAAIEPMGRVRDGKEKTANEVQVVGKSRADGTLVSAALTPPSWLAHSPKAFNHWYVHMQYRGERELADTWVVAESEQHKLRWLTDAVKRCGRNGLELRANDWCPEFHRDGLPRQSEPKYETVYHDGGFEQSHQEYRGRRTDGPAWKDPEYAHDLAVWRWLDAEAEHRLRLGAECDLTRLKTEWAEVRDEECLRLGALQREYDTACALPLIVLAGLRYESPR
jgi:hypothetical protein